MQITGQTKIVGIIGDPIKHSRSPQIHNAAITALGLDYVYVPFHVQPDNLGAAIEGFKAANVVGINVTIPHKQNVISYLDEISREATLIGAVNTLIFSCKMAELSARIQMPPASYKRCRKKGSTCRKGVRLS